MMSSAPSVLLAQPKLKRASHPKVRTGCLTCKRRRVRCDERKPYCKGCVRMGLTCEYAQPEPAATKRKPVETVQLLRKIFPAPVPIWTEADSLRTAYYSAFQRYDPAGISNSEAWAHAVPRESFTDDVFSHLCMSLGSLSQSSVARSLAGSNYQGFIPLATSSPADAAHAKSIRHYASALSCLRSRLASEDASLSPRKLVLSSGAMSCFELMQGNFSWNISIACLTILGDAVISRAQSGDSDRFGLSALIKDDLAVEESEAIQLRLAVMSLLGQPQLVERSHRRDVPIPHPVLGTEPRPQCSMETFRQCWNTFARMFESWKLACYWDICLNGLTAKLPGFRDDQRVLVSCLLGWEKALESRIRLHRYLSSDQDCSQTLRLLLLYVRSMQLFLAPEETDPQRIESLRATDMADISQLPLRTISRFIDGFWFGYWNECLADTRLLLMIKILLLKRERPAVAINTRLAQLQLDHGEAIWYQLIKYYESSMPNNDPGFIPVRTRLNWTCWWWEPYRKMAQTSIDDMCDADSSYSSSSDAGTNHRDGHGLNAIGEYSDGRVEYKKLIV